MEEGEKRGVVFCLFVFLLIVLGGGLRLNPGGAFMAAATGTPLYPGHAASSAG